jgi:hypothetical protein
MNRAQAQTYLENAYQDLATEAGIDHTTQTLAYQTAIDQALRQLGFVETDLPTAVATDPQTMAYIALLDYFVLLRYLRIFTPRVDVKIVRMLESNRSQILGHIHTLLDEAQARCVQLGVSPTRSMVPVRYDLDFLEPMVGEF